MNCRKLKENDVLSRLCRCLMLFCLAIAWLPAAVAQDSAADDEYLPKSWKEVEITLPPAPLEQNLQAIYLNAVAQNRFLVDLENLRVDPDGVVRYTLVVLTPGGARNVTYEGMRCETRQWRVYATGRADGDWSRARRVEWLPVRDEAVNRHHAALFLDYFCVDGVIANDAAAARANLRHPRQPLVTN
jgi:hypothetical protein